MNREIRRQIQGTIVVFCVCFFILLQAMRVQADSGALTQSAFDKKISSLKEKYPNDFTWTGTYAGGKQCWGFAPLIADSVFGGSCNSEWKKKTDILPRGYVLGVDVDILLAEVNRDG